MTYDRDKRHRRSIRLAGYDYAQAGAYFVTICTNKREFLFGEMVDGAVLLNELGAIAVDEWLRTATVRHRVSLDAFVVMPNHLHGIILITNDDLHTPIIRRGDPPGRPYKPNRARGPRPGSIGAIVGQFKAAATRRINAVRGTPVGPVWQRNYFDHIIRDEAELNEIRQYITDNPAAWETDENNPRRHLRPGMEENRRPDAH
jgi:putative transposase